MIGFREFIIQVMAPRQWLVWRNVAHLREKDPAMTANEGTENSRDDSATGFSLMQPTRSNASTWCIISTYKRGCRPARTTIYQSIFRTFFDYTQGGWLQAYWSRERTRALQLLKTPLLYMLLNVAIFSSRMPCVKLFKRRFHDLKKRDKIQHW